MMGRFENTRSSSQNLRDVQHAQCVSRFFLLPVLSNPPPLFHPNRRRFAAPHPPPLIAGMSAPQASEGTVRCTGWGSRTPPLPHPHTQFNPCADIGDPVHPGKELSDCKPISVDESALGPVALTWSTFFPTGTLHKQGGKNQWQDA